MKKLSNNNILKEFRNKIARADYSSGKIINGVKIIELMIHVLEEGDLSEIIRLNGNGKLIHFPNFKLTQINRVKQAPNTVKAWHLHFNQDEVWYVAPSDNLFVGLWDVREKSETANLTMRIVLGGNNSLLLYIPRGVAHGSANFSYKDTDLYSMVNRQFDIKNPDEMRLPWDSLGKEFWQPLKD